MAAELCPVAFYPIQNQGSRKKGRCSVGEGSVGIEYVAHTKIRAYDVFREFSGQDGQPRANPADPKYDPRRSK